MCLLSLVLCLIVGIDYSIACTCTWSHAQEHFCKADYVMRIRLTSPERYIYKKYKVSEVDAATNNTQSTIHRTLLGKQYNVRVKKIYKITENTFGFTKNTTTAQLHTAASDSACGVRLEKMRDYLVSGFYASGKLHISLCGWVKPWPWISKQQTKYLKLVYAANCDCEISDPYMPKEIHVKDRECQWEASQKTNECYERESACIHDSNSVTSACKWHRNFNLRECIKGKLSPIQEP